jgi:hypothetical protein
MPKDFREKLKEKEETAAAAKQAAKEAATAAKEAEKRLANAKQTVSKLGGAFDAPFKKITAFFKSCGLLSPDTPEGTSFPMSLFEQVVGCTGKVKVTVTKSTGNNGREYENNEFQFVVPKASAGTSPATTYAPPQQTQQRSWGGQGF